MMLGLPFVLAEVAAHRGLPGTEPVPTEGLTRRSFPQLVAAQKAVGRQKTPR